MGKSSSDNCSNQRFQMVCRSVNPSVCRIRFRIWDDETDAFGTWLEIRNFVYWVTKPLWTTPWQSRFLVNHKQVHYMMMAPFWVWCCGVVYWSLGSKEESWCGDEPPFRWLRVEEKNTSVESTPTEMNPTKRVMEQRAKNDTSKDKVENGLRIRQVDRAPLDILMEEKVRRRYEKWICYYRI